MRRVAVFAATALVSGCGGSAPPRSTNARGVRAGPAKGVAVAQATHEYPSPQPRQSVAGASPSALDAIYIFATAYINWTADTVSRNMRALAAISVGQARSAAELAASQTAGDYELKRGGIANSGTVEAIAPLGAEPNRYVVVTRELTTATATTAYQGLLPAWHVAIATVLRLAPGAWVVSGWQPES